MPRACQKEGAEGEENIDDDEVDERLEIEANKYCSNIDRHPNDL